MTMLLEEVLPYLRKGRKAVCGGLTYRIDKSELQRSVNEHDWMPSTQPSLDGYTLIPEQFDFLEAVRRMQAGKKVRRPSWLPHVFAVESNGYVAIGSFVPNTIAVENITATDWQECE